MKIRIFIGILVLGVFSISINFIFGDSDFILELKDVSKVPTISKLELDGESSMQICPSGKCEIVVINSSFSLPTSTNLTIAHTINFNVKFNLTDINVDSKQKEHFEKFSESMDPCLIYDIIKDKGREIYFCSSVDIINRISDSKSWYYDSIGIYDAIKNTYTVKGDFISNSPE
ncbi:MAG TPA: hypothetical protein VK882_02100 [Nitrososphaeraceae archaeon]|jgi:hypothetical protein|nr:hypothetical protein [Nitrososphaeraceae archaeon]